MCGYRFKDEWCQAHPQPEPDRKSCRKQDRESEAARARASKSRMFPHICAGCGTAFLGLSWQRFCRLSCRLSHRSCMAKAVRAMKWAAA